MVLRAAFQWFLILLSLLYFQNNVSAYELKQKPVYSIKKAQQKISVDGILDEPDWQLMHVADSFYQNFPGDTSYAVSRTEVRITYDERNIYIAAKCYDEIAGKYVIQSLRRDFNTSRNDAFSVFIDPQNDNTNGFDFTVSALGVQREGILVTGGGSGANTAWDNKWYSAVTNYEDYWIVEIAIPFKSIRYNPEIKNWGINFLRNDLKRNESSVWSPVPRNFGSSSLTFAGELVWEESPPAAGINLSVIPYLRINYGRNYEKGEPAKTIFSGGSDFKAGITSSLNLDVTINPDFSQAEVDEQVINLDRFSIFFPERRNFFQENSDLFASFGFSKIRPFFSRRIGLDERGRVVPIIAGARLSGKVDANWRIGAMNMQTSPVTSDNILSQNYSVAAVQRKIAAASNISGIFVNRQAFDKNFIFGNYNRVAGIDYNLATKDNKWMGKAFYHHSFSPNQPKDAYAHASWLMYNTQAWQFHWNHEYVGKNYKAETGFVPRSAYWRLEPMVHYNFYRKGWLYRHGPEIYLSLYTNQKIIVTDGLTRLGYSFNFLNSSRINFGLTDYFVKLTSPFDVTGRRQQPHPTGNYRFQFLNANYSSNFRKRYYFEAFSQYGGYFTGTSFSFGGSVSYRWQPYMVFSLKLDRNEIRLPEPYRNAYLTLVGPRIEASFSRSLFLTTWLQYNDQVQRVNLNTRLQWRFAPMSDIFIVYNRNFNSATFLNASPNFTHYPLAAFNHDLIVKLSWWLNI